MCEEVWREGEGGIRDNRKVLSQLAVEMRCTFRLQTFFGGQKIGSKKKKKKKKADKRLSIRYSYLPKLSLSRVANESDRQDPQYVVKVQDTSDIGLGPRNCDSSTATVYKKSNVFLIVNHIHQIFSKLYNLKGK
jgi:hypothetical protein